MREIKISLLGPLKIEYNNNSIYNKLSHKARCILCYLATEKYVPKEKLACMFWEESSETASKYNLRYNIWSVNKLFKDLTEEDDVSFLEWDKDSLVINKRFTMKPDIEEFNQLYDNETEYSIDILTRLKNKYKGSFLEGLHLKDSFDFNDWLFFQREHYQRKYLNILYQTFNYYKTNNLTHKAIEAIEEMLRLNPLDEDVYTELIELYLYNGDRMNALKTYNRCVHVLREELNISPKESTEELLKKIKNKEVNNNQSTPINNETEFYIIKPENIESIINKAYDSKNKKILFINTMPLKNLNYGLLSTMIDIFINTYPDEELFRVRPAIWSELYKINIRTYKYFKKFIHLNSPDTEQCRIYSAMTELIHNISNIEPFNLVINNFQYIDDFSFEYIKYALFKTRKDNPRLILITDENEERTIELKKFFTISKY